MSIGWESVGLVLLGAGGSRRFGSDKLGALLAGEPVLRRTGLIYEALPLAQRVLVRGRSSPSLADMGFVEVVTVGVTVQSQSLALGLQALRLDRLQAVMIALADMPLVRLSHVDALRRHFDGVRPICSGDNEQRLPPALFPVAMAGELLVQEGDRGGRQLLAQAAVVSATPCDLIDIDTPADLARAESTLLSRGTARN